MRRLALALILAALSACSTGLPPLPPQSRPDLQSDEAGLWLAADRLESGLRQSPSVIDDPALNRYVQGIACKVAGAYCPDIRVVLVRQPGLNGFMAPNGLLLLQSGLLLRLRDEAQLAAVIGHELGHYVERHGYDQSWRERVGADVRAWISVLGQIGSEARKSAETVAEWQRRAFNRQQERAADAFGLGRMTAAGYAPGAAAEVWLAATAEQGERRTALVNRLLAQHPEPDERAEALREQAAAIPAPPTARGYVRYQAALAPHRPAFLADEVRLRLPTVTVRLFEQLRRQQGLDATLAFHWGEVYRLRGWKDDRRLALRYYGEALALPRAPAAAHRSIGLIQRAEADWPAARAAFGRYLEAAPDAADAPMIRAYLAEMAGV